MRFYVRLWSLQRRSSVICAYYQLWLTLALALEYHLASVVCESKSFFLSWRERFYVGCCYQARNSRMCSHDTCTEYIDLLKPEIYLVQWMTLNESTIHLITMIIHTLFRRDENFWQHWSILLGHHSIMSRYRRRKCEQCRCRHCEETYSNSHTPSLVLFLLWWWWCKTIVRWN